MRVLFPSSLRGRFVLLMVLFVCALGAPLVFALPARIDALSRRWAESRSVGIARLLAASTEAALDFDDGAGAEALLAKLGSTPGTVWAALLRADGTRLARWRHPPLTLAPCPDEKAQIEYEPGLMKVRVPVVGRSGPLGTLALAFDLGELEGSLRGTRGWLTTGASVALVVGLLGAVAIGTFVVQPLQRMTRVAERIHAGDLSAANALETGRRDETGALARAFESMLERLQEKQAALSSTNAELSGKLAELRSAQEQLVAADRRINVGRLAASVAHEVNNPLAYVSSNLRYVSKWLPAMAAALRSLDPGAQKHDGRSVGEMEKALAQASEGTERIRQIVKGLKTFSRSDDDRREQLALGSALEAAIAMAGHEIVQRARLLKEYGEAPPVLASEVRLTQVFLNLLINAAQAVPEGASDRHTITVATRSGPSGWAVAEVRDTGCGIPPENLNKLFSSFFTTKPVGVGTGLGLSISQGIVQGLGGRMEVESEPGRGSTFRVLLPPATEALPSPEIPALAPAPRSGGSLLVVDDEPLVAEAISRELGGELRVVIATNAGRALARIAAEPFQHILCDLMMPGMSGAALHDEVAFRHPELAERFIFMTGGAFTPAARAFLSAWKGRVLEKPIDLNTLRRYLDGPA